MDFYTLFPDIQPWVASLQTTYPVTLLNQTQWGFAAIQAVHLLALGLLGGCVILLNMRLMGVGMTSATPALMERNLRPWLISGVAAVLLTGIVIGMLNPEKLYTSPAFFTKMIAMVSALIFSFAVTNNVARQESGVKLSPLVMAMAAIAFGLWLWSIGVFAVVEGVNPGTIHMIVAAFAILFAFGKRTRIIAAIVLGIIVVAGAIVTHGIYNLDDNYDMVLTTEVWFVRAAAVAAVAFMGYEIFTGTTEDDRGATVKLIALFGILSWVTVAAAGRWIGFS